ncbi:hypothetical protein ADIAL_1092 [Alkalibacterium sp. AK22]|uniref:hypothetical protein n=1 Tax=Alkalibacterium sp. AK22 TaxID=1229520 RepID=UPI000448ED3E|nr:hypothetical protein [Alkalibacterium sp. AK22]EXJ23480.1 hypothetical protein ADIAL_1092 [Alkalibacterium sp. AK22]
MELILIVGPQAVGKMTVGKALEDKIDARLLFNHETIDLFARFIGYGPDTFRLSEQVRLDLFKAFTSSPESNTVGGIIFTVVVGFNLEGEFDTLREWSSMFHEAGGAVYFIELEADLNERLRRNTSDYRLKMKPSKRNTEFSTQELLSSMNKHRLRSLPKEVEKELPGVHYTRLDTTQLSVGESVEYIVAWLKETGYKTFCP